MRKVDRHVRRLARYKQVVMFRLDGLKYREIDQLIDGVRPGYTGSCIQWAMMAGRWGRVGEDVQQRMRIEEKW